MRNLRRSLARAIAFGLVLFPYLAAGDMSQAEPSGGADTNAPGSLGYFLPVVHASPVSKTPLTAPELADFQKLLANGKDVPSKHRDAPASNLWYVLEIRSHGELEEYYFMRDGSLIDVAGLTDQERKDLAALVKKIAVRLSPPER
jgi:hypothetical protein